MTTEERLENLARELAGTKRGNRWLLVAVGLVALVLVWSLAPGTMSAETAPSAQEQQPGGEYGLLIMFGLILGLLCLLGWRRRSRRRRREREQKVTINLTCPICGQVMSTPLAPPPLLHDGVKVGQTTTCPSCGKVSLVGIAHFGGWLLIPALVLILSLLKNITDTVMAVANYGPQGLFAGVVALVGVGFIMFQTCVTVLFLMKKPYAPKLVVALLVANLALGVALLWAAVAEVGLEVARGLVLAAVLIPYFLLSRRVKATFGRRGVARPNQQEGLIVSQGSGSATPP